AFREFVGSAKKDFVLFQLEVQLKEVGGDLNKKNSLVNQIAETLSKINKPEDFTKLQEYVRKCASLLRIDETGLTQLVNKFKRDKMVKEEKKMSYDEAAILMPSFPQGQEQHVDTDLFTDKDLAHEKNLVKLIIDYGNELTKENKLVAQWIFDEIETFPLENEDMVYLVEAYKKWFYAGKLPNGKTLQYHEDERVQKWVVSLFEPDHELSQRWNEKLGKPEREVVKDIINEIEIGLMYFKLRKVKKMISQNQMDLETAAEKEQIQLLQIHKHLKEVERELTKGIGTVILK
ncbi:MAG: DNA primase, partial [Chitinophagaceae bacterium]|nr:DNA primase [Chitinophagaceae bacterium]